MSKFFPELFPDDGKNIYRYLVVIVAIIGLFVAGNEGYEVIFLSLMIPAGCWLVYNLIPDDERKF